MSYWKITEVIDSVTTEHIVWSKRDIQILLDTCILPKLKIYKVDSSRFVRPEDRKDKDYQHLRHWSRIGWNFFETKEGSTLKFKVNFAKGE